MAKPTAPLLSFDAGGQIGKSLVFAKWRGQSYARRYVVPSNPQSSEQVVTRSLFAWLSNVWKASPTLFREAFTLAATGRPLTDRNIFIGHNVTLMRGDTDLSHMEFSPGAKGGIAPDDITLTPGSGSINVAFTNPAAPTGWAITSAIAACLKDQDPQSESLYQMTAAEDTSTFNSVALTGLDAGDLYYVGAWLKWSKPDGSTAYSASLLASATPSA